MDRTSQSDTNPTAPVAERRCRPPSRVGLPPPERRVVGINIGNTFYQFDIDGIACAKRSLSITYDPIRGTMLDSHLGFEAYYYPFDDRGPAYLHFPSYRREPFSLLAALDVLAGDSDVFVTNYLRMQKDPIPSLLY